MSERQQLQNHISYDCEAYQIHELITLNMLYEPIYYK